VNVDVDLLALEEDVSAAMIRFKKGDDDSDDQLDYPGPHSLSLLRQETTGKMTFVIWSLVRDTASERRSSEYI